MQVPEHIVSLYVATCGQNGQNLGSDEKEIILLVYTVLDPINAQIIGEKQILVKPEGNINKDCTISTNFDSLNSNNANNEKSNYDTNSAINERTLNLKPINNNNNNNNLSNNINSPNGNALLRQNSNELSLVPAAQETGIPLSEAIEESDQFLRSLFHNNEKALENLQILTDGQLPVRQSLHREACVKDITLPAYYGRFSDLRKEYVRYKSGDLSRALVPVKDIKKIMQLPATPLPPQSIAEILTELSLPSCEETDFFLRESRDMVSVVKFLLNAGHKFYANEIVNLVLEPGICSIDEEIDGNCIVRARGLPWQSSDQDIAKFFRGLNVAKGGVALCLSPLGRRNGEALIRFISQEHRDMALKRHKHHIGSRYIEVYRATGEDFLAVAGGASNEAKAFLSKGAQVIIRMRGLPYDCTAKQVLDFFTAGDSPCNVLDAAEGVLFVKKPDGRATGDAFVLFANEADAPKALSRHRESIGQRYIELFRSTTAEVQQVLNRSLDPKTYETNQQPPLIAQLPTMPLSLLPQHFITSGTAKNCIRLRGLPYEALVEHILHFLDDFAKHIIYQGVHMVINAQGQPSGEAFIQMDTEESARLCAQRKHNQFMVFGKKYRYIEVFQCSGDDMNLVLNGGLQTMGTATGLHHPHHAGGKQPPLLSPGMLTQTPPSNAQAIGTSHRPSQHLPHVHSHTLPAALQSSNPSSIQPTSASAAAAAAAVAALSQSPHTQHHLGLNNPTMTSPPPNVLASLMSAQVSAPPPQPTTPTTASTALMPHLGNMHATPPTLSFNNTPTNAITAANFPFTFQQNQNAAAAAAAAAAAQAQVPNSAFLAQQQAQFIAQQSLLARQQAAAAAAAAEQQQFFAAANLFSPLLMQHHPSSAAVAAQNAQTTAMNNAAAAAAAVNQPQFFLMPRPSYFQTAYPFGYAMPPPAQNYAQYTGAGGNAGLLQGSNAAAQAATATSAHSAAKRSYEHAFQQDLNATSAAKRALTRTPTNVYPYYSAGI